MVRCGELCKVCGSACGKDYQTSQIQIECPVCNGTGIGRYGSCDHCTDGHFLLGDCPREIIGSEMIEAINLASMCGQGDWPISGGLLNQSAWFLALKQQLDSEQSKIESEQVEKAGRRGS